MQLVQTLLEYGRCSIRDIYECLLISIDAGSEDIAEIIVKHER